MKYHQCSRKTDPESLGREDADGYYASIISDSTITFNEYLNLIDKSEDSDDSDPLSSDD
jgi:hypothetical protein